MYNHKEVNKADSLCRFMLTMIEEYEHKLSQVVNEKKTYMNELLEKEAFIHTLNQTQEKNANVFSPNSKEYNIEEHNAELEKIRRKIDCADMEEEKLDFSILHLQEIYATIANQDASHINMSLNILDLQEKDRQRIARDLHDSTVQNLTSLIHKCQLCSRLVDMDSVRTKLELTTMSNVLKSVINEIREIIYNLKPMSLDDLGLITTVEKYVEQLMMANDIKIKFSHNKEKEDILPVINLSIFRMIQEACNNAIKHAEAKQIDIDITYEENDINVLIKDDGKGFDAMNRKEQVTPEYCGYGLSIMKERVYLLAGTIKIQSTINKGTNIIITIPITKSEGEE